MNKFIVSDTLKKELAKAQSYTEEVKQCQYCKHCRETDDGPPECHLSCVGYFTVRHTGSCNAFEKK